MYEATELKWSENVGTKFSAAKIRTCVFSSFNWRKSLFDLHLLDFIYHCRRDSLEIEWGLKVIKT